MSTTFADLGVPDRMTASLSDRGIITPFPIQVAAIPDALAGRDICGHAPTGSGKTLAYGLPLAVGAASGQGKGPHALVLVPTRELCAQVAEELSALLPRRKGPRVVAVYGGTSDRPQRRALADGAPVVVACPGRLEDLLGQGALRLDNVRQVVIDEADRMADMGFLPAVRRILDLTPDDRQTQLFSATLGGPVATLIRDYQSEPAHHEVDRDRSVIESAQHHFWRVGRTERGAVTAELVQSLGASVVFCRTRHGASRLAKRLARLGVVAADLHGGLNQSQRDRALASFADGRVQALVATDVAARGIHVDGVASVIHYDLPGDAETYVHRSGRTARAGSAGIVVTLADETNTKAARALQRSLGLPDGLDAPHTLAAAVPVAASPRPADTRTTGGAKSNGARSRGANAKSNGATSGRAETGDAKASGAESGRTNAKTARAETGDARNDRTHRAEPGADDTGGRGRVKFFDARKGYGFIARTGEVDLFVHHSNVAAGGRSLTEGDAVVFRVGPGRRGDEGFDVRPEGGERTRQPRQRRR